MDEMYTQRQMRFIVVFTHQTQALLKEYFEIKAQDPNANISLAPKLDIGYKGISALSAGVSLAGVVGAAPTMGASLAAAAGCIVLLQTAEEGYQFVKRHANDKHEPFNPEETQSDMIFLSLKIILRKMAYLTAVRYRHFIDEIIEENSINAFAIYAARSAAKMLDFRLIGHHDLSIDIKAEDFLAYLLEHIKLSYLRHNPTAAIKPEYASQHCIPSLKVYIKSAFSCAGLAVFDPAAVHGYRLFTAVKSPTLQYNTNDQFGFISVNESELLSKTAAIKRSRFKPLPDQYNTVSIKAIQHLCSYYPIERQEVTDYMQQVKQDLEEQKPILSLNQYLSKLLKNHVIAECHDDRLSGLDLSEGDFSEVMFDGVVIRDCNLQNSIWTKAHLNESLFTNSIIAGAHFDAIFAERSQWVAIDFCANFLQAKLNGAVFDNSSIKPLISQFGLELELASLHNMAKEESIEELLNKLQLQLDREHQERVQLEQKINELNQHLDMLIDTLFSKHLSPVINQLAITDFQAKIEQLEFQYPNHAPRDLRLQALKEHPNIKQEISEELDRRIKEELLDTLKLPWNIKTSSPKHQSDSAYIELNAASRSNPQTPTPLQECFTHFLNSKAQLLLLHGDAGSGKTTSVMHWYEVLKHQFEWSGGYTEWLPIYIRLNNPINQNTNQNFLKLALETVLDINQLPKLMKHFQCVIICDGLEESGFKDINQIINQSLELNALWGKNAPKIVFTTQTQYLMNKPIQHNKISNRFRFAIRGLDDQQITKYVENQVLGDTQFMARYQRLLQQDPGIRSMLKNPGMLHIICKIVHDHDKELLSRFEFYTVFSRRWFHKEKEKLADKKISYRMFEQSMENMVFKMYLENQDWIEQPHRDSDSSSTDTDSDEGNALPWLASNSDEEKNNMLAPCGISTSSDSPASHYMDHYKLCNLPLNHFYLAKKLIRILIDPDKTRRSKMEDWNHVSLLNSPDIFDFMLDFIKDSDAKLSAEKTLRDMVTSVQNDNDSSLYPHAVANAQALLERWVESTKNQIPSNLVDIEIPSRDSTLSHTIRIHNRLSLFAMDSKKQRSVQKEPVENKQLGIEVLGIS